jgi:transcriptional regulator with XRE-family HTH domain
VSALKNLRVNLKRLRLSLGLTQQALAEKADIEYKYYQRVESGRWPGLQLGTVERLSQAVGVEAWELIAPQRGRHRTTTTKK